MFKTLVSLMLFSSDFGITPCLLGGFDSLENWDVWPELTSKITIETWYQLGGAQ